MPSRKPFTRSIALSFAALVLLAAVVPAHHTLGHVIQGLEDGGYDLTLYTRHAMKNPNDDPLHGLPEGSYELADGRVAVPMKIPKPGWYTEAVHANVLAASALGMGYDVKNGTAVALGSQFLFIRPGAMMLFPSGCTMNFIYGTPGNYQIGSAGHCNEVNSEVVIVAAPSLLVAIGKTGRSHDNGIGDDWSLTPIYSRFQQYVDANTPVGGPECGSYTGTASLTNPVPLKHFGHGLVVGTGGTPRAGVATKMDNRAFYFDSPSMFGDSGSAVQVAGSSTCPRGQAVGVLTHLVIGTKTLPSNMAGTRMGAIPATVTNGDVNPLP